MKFNDELILLLKARYPIIYINTIEEDRVEYVIRKHIKANLNRSIYSWDFVDGYTNNPNNEGFGKRNPLQALELIERLTITERALVVDYMNKMPYADMSVKYEVGESALRKRVQRIIDRLRDEF